MPKRANGEGSITQRPDGRWQARLQLDGKRLSLYGKTRKEVVEKLRKLTDIARQNGRLPVSSNITVGEYLQSWLETAQHLRPTTLADYTVIITAHIVPRIGSTRLSKLSPLQLARFYRSLGQGLSARRVRMVHDLLHKALNDAQAWGLIAANPTALVDRPKRGQMERRLWTPEDVQLFIQAVAEGQGGHYGDLLLFLLASGCRLGEALGLRWNDIDFKDGTVRIERQLTEVNGKHIEQGPKTKAGIRTITVPGFGLEALRRRKERAASLRVFVTEAGTTPLRSNVRRALHGLCERLGLPRIRVHDLRHLHLSILAMSGVPVKVAQQRAGHSSAQVTLNIYQHVLGDGDRLAAEALDRVLKSGAV